jgi:hypothetical protein
MPSPTLWLKIQRRRREKQSSVSRRDVQGMLPGRGQSGRRQGRHEESHGRMRSTPTRRGVARMYPRQLRLTTSRTRSKSTKIPNCSTSCSAARPKHAGGTTRWQSAALTRASSPLHGRGRLGGGAVWRVLLGRDGLAQGDPGEGLRPGHQFGGGDGPHACRAAMGPILGNRGHVNRTDASL